MNFLFILRTTVLSTNSSNIPLTLGRKNWVCCFGGKKIMTSKRMELTCPPQGGKRMGRERELREHNGSHKRSRNYSRELREHTPLINLQKNYSKPPRFDIGWINLNSSFRKRTMKSKAPTWSPQEISGFLKFPPFFRAQMSPPIWREYLNYSNITWKRSLIFKIPCVLKIFSKPRRFKHSPATGVLERVLPGRNLAIWPECKKSIWKK